MGATSAQGRTGGKPTHVVRGFAWQPVKAPIKTTDVRILGAVPQNDPRRQSHAFSAELGDYKFYANAGEPAITI